MALRSVIRGHRRVLAFMALNGWRTGRQAKVVSLGE